MDGLEWEGRTSELIGVFQKLPRAVSFHCKRTAIYAITVAEAVAASGHPLPEGLDNHTSPTDDNILRLLAPSFAGLVVCAVCLAGTTWTWFSASVQAPPQKTATASYEIAVSILDGSGGAVTDARQKGEEDEDAKVPPADSVPSEGTDPANPPVTESQPEVEEPVRTESESTSTEPTTKNGIPGGIATGL